MQARDIRDKAATALGDRAWQRSLGASCLLHGALLAALIATWNSQPKPQPVLRPIAVTLVHTDETATERATQPAQAAPENAAPVPEAPAAPPLKPPVVATKLPTPPAPPAKPAHPSPSIAKPAPPPPARTTPAKPDATITALLSESLDGRPRDAAAPHGAAIALRSSAKLSDDYMLRLQAWIGRAERYPAEARARHQEGKGVVAFTIARDGKVTRVWLDQSTGSSLLDQASIATIHDASPMPALPHDIAGDSVNFYLPISYSLNTFERLFQ